MTLSITVLTVVIPSVAYFNCLAGGHYAECRYDECRYAECRGAAPLVVLANENTTKTLPRKY